MLDTSTDGGPGMPQEWYEIRVEGHLPSGWSYWFEGMNMQPGPDGDSILSGPLPDQPALHGVLAKIRDLNLKLISVTRRTT
jgi:hypothetical protein